MKHRKKCNHPFMFGEPIEPASGAKQRAPPAARPGERQVPLPHTPQVLISSQMTSLLNVIEDYLLYREWRYCRIDGTTKIDEQPDGRVQRGEDGGGGRDAQRR